MSARSSRSPAEFGRAREIVSVEGAQSIKRRHEARLKDAEPPEPDVTPELASAYHSLQLHWLATFPSYREEIKGRVNEAARARAKRTQRIDVALGIEQQSLPRYGAHEGRPRTTPHDARRVDRGLREMFDELHRDDVDNLGREIEGCG
jgi:hypothetical protein